MLAASIISTVIVIVVSSILIGVKWHHACDFREYLGGELHDVLRNRARTQVLLQAWKLRVYGSGTFGAFCHTKIRHARGFDSIGVLCSKGKPMPPNTQAAPWNSSAPRIFVYELSALQHIVDHYVDAEMRICRRQVNVEITFRNTLQALGSYGHFSY